MSSTSNPPPPEKSSSEILNELFSTFDPSLKSLKKKSKKDKKKKKKKSQEDSDEELSAKSQKKRKLIPSTSKKVKKSNTSLLVSPTKRKKKREKGTSKKPGKPDLEDGEILEEQEKKKKHRRKSTSEHIDHHHVKLDGMSASQAFKMDAEERILLGYEEKPSTSSKRYHDGGTTESRTSSSRSHHHHTHRSKSPGSRNSSRHRSRSRSPPPRLAPPRETYRNSYMKFKKQSTESESYSGRSSSSSFSSQSAYDSKYDTEKYYDYHSKRSRTDYSSSRSGFGYVQKSYYYDDVDDEQHSSRDHNNRDSRDSSRYGTSAWRHRARSKSPPRRSYYHPEDIIDKSELLEIARKNAKKLMQRGVLPSDIFSRDQILALKAGGRSVDELTSYCKRLAKRDAAGDARDRRGSDNSDSDDDSRGGSGRRFIHHPFQVKDRPLPTITLNIRNSIPLPVRTPQELAIESGKLRTQFPVSSGTQHRFKELEWKPVQDDSSKKNEDDSSSKALVPLTSNSSPSETPLASIPESSGGELKAIEAAAPPSPPKETEDTGITVDGPDLPAVDISSVIGLRLKAMRSLQENPSSDDAKKQLEEASKMMKDWADAKALEPKFLTAAELQSGPQAWAKRDQLRKTRALDSGMGMHLLQKMGWRPGEGLGKNKEGQLEPLALDVKMDKKGLTAAVEELMYGKRGGNGAAGPSMPVVYDLSGKHPVSALMELTAKRRWGSPEFELCFEHGPSHKKQFVYKVIVNGVEYQPCIAVGNKKQAKSNAAAFCLQSLGLLPTVQVGGGQASEMLQTVQANEPTVVVGAPQEENRSTLLKQQFNSSPSLLKTVKDPEPCPPPDRELMPPPPPPLLFK